MKRKRRPRRKTAASPFALYGEMLRAAVTGSELLFSSAEVIAHRSLLIGRAMQGEVPLSHAEFSRMWLEKMNAGAEGWAQWQKGLYEAMRASGKPVDWDEALRSQMKLMGDVMNPYHKKATANARRLRRTKRKGK